MSTEREPSGGNLSEWLEWGTDQLSFLEKREARLECEQILEALLGISRSELYLAPRPRPLLFAPYSEWVRVRKRHTPLAYLLGKTPFWEDEFRVEGGVFIPRPETETLIEAFLETSGFAKEDRFSFLDLGTGSGNIAVTIARVFPNSRGLATDLSEKALALARKNARGLGASEQIQFIQADGLQAFGPGTFDVIFSNPPYVAFRDLASLEPEVHEEPHLALAGGEEGLDFYQKIFQGLGCLRVGGSLWVEIGWGARERVQAFFKKKFRGVRVSRDLNQIERVVSGIDFCG